MLIAHLQHVVGSRTRDVTVVYR